MYTEAEAKNRGCHKLLPDYIPCESSACMAWRWVMNEMKSDPVSKTHGYCGLAGKP